MAGMKRIRARLSAQEGFSLVELIVVIAILAILAAVAVPVYSGYVKKANDAAVTTELVSILTAAQAANATNANALETITVDPITNSDDANVKFEFNGSALDTFYASFVSLYGDTAEIDLSGNSITISGFGETLSSSASYTNGATGSSDDGWKAATS
ncbi:MAG: prepilin-type N-terminal cleavage/methylation domain-containing protein [Oscillospiraceae bacterium]|nr:prepilin-type N-terminal cleavage/methylation domain-containing protein [Oscillospiraceae bacterium]